MSDKLVTLLFMVLIITSAVSCTSKFMILTLLESVIRICSSMFELVLELSYWLMITSSLDNILMKLVKLNVFRIIRSSMYIFVFLELNKLDVESSNIKLFIVKLLSNVISIKS